MSIEKIKKKEKRSERHKISENTNECVHDMLTLFDCIHRHTFMWNTEFKNKETMKLNLH